jgi:hypothetical protein
MLTTRSVRATGDLPARVALGALAMLATTEAHAEGEETPMIGASVVAAHAGEHDTELAGVEAEAVWWFGWIGLSSHGSLRWDTGRERPRANVLGGSVRVQLFEGLVTSPIDPRDVEVALELHGIHEHTWWDGSDATGYGVGAALRLRGGGDDDQSTLLAESRLFLRVTSTRWAPLEAVARSVAAPEAHDANELTILLGIGASWGSGDADYVERFRMRPFGPAMLP